MGRRSTLIVYAGAVALSLLVLGFIVFASSTSRRPHSNPFAPGFSSNGLYMPPLSADGIVVLTGARRRIEAGLDLLRQGFGSRLLISGVNRRVTPDDVLRMNGTDALATGCCIDFGYDALDTKGNASETRAWVGYHGFSRVIVVTSSYHMPRSLNELALALPDVELIAFPVVPRIPGERPWWLSASAIRVLASEYLKLVPSYAKSVLCRLLPSGETTVAGPAHRPPQAGERAASLAN